MLISVQVVVCAVLHEGKSISEDEIIEFCRERLAEYKVPEGVVFFDKLPYNANGKGAYSLRPRSTKTIYLGLLLCYCA